MRRSRVVALLVLALIGATACGRYLSAGAAVVNGVSISQDELDARLEGLLRQGGAAPEGRVDIAREVLSQMIQEELVRQEIERRGLRVPEEEVEAGLAQVRGRFGSEQEFQSALQQQGFDVPSLRRRLSEELLQNRLRADLIKDTPVPDAEVRRQYQRTRRSFEEIRVRHILFSAEAGEDAALRRARSALARLRGGADFADLARRLSEDPGSAQQGGDLGFVRRGRFVPEFEQAAFSLRPRTVSEPVRSSFGYHLILVQARRIVPFAEAAEEIRTQLSQERGEQAFQTWLGEVLGSAEIEVNPRYGDWDAEQRTIVPHRFFVPAEPETEPVLPEDQPLPEIQILPQQ